LAGVLGIESWGAIYLDELQAVVVEDNLSTLHVSRSDFCDEKRSGVRGIKRLTSRTHTHIYMHTHTFPHI
jgi:hypothetical protein